MAYSSKYGKRPDELASKSSHSNIINDKDVKAFINDCEYPKSKDDITLDPALIVNIEYPEKIQLNTSLLLMEATQQFL
ncbi:MAG: hypothetical protein IPP37_15305 [Saprospiraceae bacterium]|nr:hypothetical protein [Saprospiraceae bacterium]